MNDIITLFLSVLFFVAVWLWHRKIKNYARSVILWIKLKRPEASSIVGHIDYVQDGDKMLEYAKNVTDYGPIPACRVLLIPIFCIYEPEHIRAILGSPKVRSDKNFFYTLGKMFLGNGLLTYNGSKWKNHRAVLQPFFNMNTVQKHLKSFLECAEDISAGFSDNEYVNITSVVNHSVLRTLSKVVLGTRIEDVDNSPFRSNSHQIFSRLKQPWLLVDSIFKQTRWFEREKNYQMTLRNFILEIIEKRIELRNRNEEEIAIMPCLMNELLKAHENDPKGFTEEDVINEINTFMAVGQDSMSTFLTIFLYYIAKNPSVQEKIFNEVRDILPEVNTKEITALQLSKMTYLKQCFDETLRLSPTAPIFARVLRDDVELGEFTIPAGANITIVPLATHRLEKYFPDPLKFDPDRFSLENVKKIHPFAYYPFSIGPRNCIGGKFAILQGKTILASILRKYEITLKPGTEELHFKYNVVYKVRGGIWLRAKLRE